MNAERRKAIDALMAKFETLISEVEGLAEDVDSIKAEEEDYRDNLPDSFQNGEKGDKAQESIDALNEAYDKMEEVTSALGDARDSLENAKGE